MLLWMTLVLLPYLGQTYRNFCMSCGNCTVSVCHYNSKMSLIAVFLDNFQHTRCFKINFGPRATKGKDIPS